MGLGWWWLLLSGGLQFYVIATVVIILLAVPVCTAAEKILGQKDPSSVVLDELVVMPLIWLPVLLFSRNDGSPLPGSILHGVGWEKIGAGFLAFRLFDIWKPWPIGLSQRLPAGWGVVVDDVLAALAASLVPLGMGWWQLR